MRITGELFLLDTSSWWATIKHSAGRSFLNPAMGSLYVYPTGVRERELVTLPHNAATLGCYFSKTFFSVACFEHGNQIF